MPVSLAKPPARAAALTAAATHGAICAAATFATVGAALVATTNPAAPAYGAGVCMAGVAGLVALGAAALASARRHYMRR